MRRPETRKERDNPKSVAEATRRLHLQKTGTPFAAFTLFAFMCCVCAFGGPIHL
jgi:hypothetical protein